MIVLETKVTSAPLETQTHPPFSIIAVAVPPLEMRILPPTLTVVLFAVPPLEMYMESSKDNVIPLEITSAET